MQDERGAVYGVSGLPWLRETLISAASLRRQMPELPLELHINRATCELLPDGVALESFFNFISESESFPHWRGPKFAALRSTRFVNSLYRDGDTYVTARLDELFELLDRFDIAAMPAPQRIHRRALACGLYEMFPPVPAAFPEYNDGVMPFRRSRLVGEFFDHWRALVEQGLEAKGYRMDQATFRVALYHSGLRVCALTPEHNLRAGVPNVVKGEVKVIHAHGRLAQLAQHVNTASAGMRVYMPRRDLLYGFMPKGVSRPGEATTDELKQQIAAIQCTIDSLKPS